MKMFRNVSALFVALASSAVFAAAGHAQTGVPSAEAAAFVGTWNVAVAAEPPATIKIDVTDNNGQIAASVTGMEGTVTSVQDITQSQGALVLKYVTSLQGQSLPIKITLSPQAQTGGLTASVDLADGLATFPGTVTSAGS
jgi:hypothetical protein